MKSSNRKQITILAFTLAIVMLGYGMVIPIFPFYIDQMGASGSQLGLLTATYAIMQFIFAPIWGVMSDRFGRRPILILGVLGNSITLLLFGLSTQLWMLFGARALSGILSSATLPTTMAYIADSTNDDERGGAMGKLAAAMGLGVILGPGIGGWLAGESLSTPFYFAAALSLLALILIMTLLPESLPTEKRQQQKTEHNKLSMDILQRNFFSFVGLLFGMNFLVSFALTSFEGIFGLYALEKFGYGPQQMGTILISMGLVSMVVQGIITGAAIRRLGELNVIRIALLAGAGGFVAVVMATSFSTILLTIGFFVSAIALLRPAITSLISKQVSGGQGTAMGLSNAIMSLGRMVGPIWAGFLFDTNIHLPYLSGAAILFFGFIISLCAIRNTLGEKDNRSAVKNLSQRHPA
ncbi:MFS transporter [Chloroflexota bacterium]